MGAEVGLGVGFGVGLGVGGGKLAEIKISRGRI